MRGINTYIARAVKTFVMIKGTGSKLKFMIQGHSEADLLTVSVRIAPENFILISLIKKVNKITFEGKINYNSGRYQKNQEDSRLQRGEIKNNMIDNVPLLI
jgi:hypothetical protein